MKTNKLLKVIKNFFNEDERKQQEQKKYLKEVLVELKTKGKKRLKKLDGLQNEKERKTLQKEINVICAQRKKGIKLLKSLSKKK